MHQNIYVVMETNALFMLIPLKNYEHSWVFCYDELSVCFDELETGVCDVNRVCRECNQRPNNNYQNENTMEK